MSGIYQAARQRHAPNGVELNEIPMTEHGPQKRLSDPSENPSKDGEYDVQATINQRSDLFRHTDLVELKQALQHQAAADTKAEEVTFLTEMAVTLCALSMPTFFVLEYMGELKEALGVKDLTFIIEPTGLWASHGSVTRYLPFCPSQHLRNLEDAEEVAQAIITGTWDLPTAKHQLRLVQHNTDNYPRWLILCGYPVRSGVMSVFAFGGGWTSMGWAALLGLGCGIFSEYLCTKKHPHIRRSQSYVAAFLVGMISSFLYQFGVERCCIASTLASLMYWFPGFAVTFGMCEMLNGQIVVGASRFAAGTMIGMMIGLGVLSGQAVVAIWYPNVKEWLDPAHCQSVIAHDFWFLFILFPPLFASMAIHFRMHWQQIGPPFIGCAVIYFAQYSLVNYAHVPSSFASGIATMLCVVAVGMMKHVYRHTSPTVVFLPAINLMVPGSFTVRAAFASFNGEYMGQDAANFSAIFTSISLNIAIGLFIGGMITSGVFRTVHAIPSKPKEAKAALRNMRQEMDRSFNNVASTTLDFFRRKNHDRDDNNHDKDDKNTLQVDGYTGTHTQTDSTSKGKGTLRYPDVRAVFGQQAPPPPMERTPRVQYVRATSAPQGSEVPYQVLSIDQDTISSRRTIQSLHDPRPPASQPQSPPVFFSQRGQLPSAYHSPPNNTSYQSLPLDPRLLPASNTNSPTFAFYPNDSKLMHSPFEGSGESSYTPLTPPPMATQTPTPLSISNERTLESVSEYATAPAIAGNATPPGVKKPGFTKLRPPLRVQRAKEENTSGGHQREDEGDEKEKDREGNMDTFSSFKEWLHSVNSAFAFDSSRRSSKSKEAAGDEGQASTGDPPTNLELPSITVWRASLALSDSSSSLAHHTGSGGVEQRVASSPSTQRQPQKPTPPEFSSETSAVHTPSVMQGRNENSPVSKESGGAKEGEDRSVKRALVARRSSRFTVSTVRPDGGRASGSSSEADAEQQTKSKQDTISEVTPTVSPTSVVSHPTPISEDVQSHPLGAIRSAPLSSTTPTTPNPATTVRTPRNGRTSVDMLKPPPKIRPRPPITPTSPLTSPPIEATHWQQPAAGSFAQKRTLSSDHVPGLYNQSEPLGSPSHTQGDAYWREANQMSWTSGRNYAPRQSDYAQRNQWTIGPNSSNMWVGRSTGDMLPHNSLGSPRMNTSANASGRRPRKGPFLPI